MHSNNIDRKFKIISVIDRLEKQSRLERLEKVNFDKNDLMLAITEDTGKFLNILLASMNANTVLEIGTSTGYSALWFALAFFQMEDEITQKVEKNIITIDNDPLKICTLFFFHIGSLFNNARKVKPKYIFLIQTKH